KPTAVYRTFFRAHRMTSSRGVGGRPLVPLLLVDDLLQQRNIPGFRRLLESLDVYEEIGCILIGNDLRAVQRHLIRSRVADVVDEPACVQSRRSQPGSVPGLPRIPMTLPAAELRVIGFPALRVACGKVRILATLLRERKSCSQSCHDHDERFHKPSYGL